MKYRNANASRTKSKQPLELLFKSRRSQKFRNISRKPLGESLNKVVGVSSEQSCRPSGLRILRNFKSNFETILKKQKQFWRSFCVRLLLARHTDSIIFFFLEKCHLPKPFVYPFLCLDSSLFSLRGLYEVLKRAFLNFLFTAMLY